MKVEINSDSILVAEIRNKLKENDGYCPCAIVKNLDSKCMCKDFRDKLVDPAFTGTCHCGLYVKKEIS